MRSAERPGPERAEAAEAAYARGSASLRALRRHRIRFAARARRETRATTEVLGLIDLVYATVLDPGRAPAAPDQRELLADLLRRAGAPAGTAPVACHARSGPASCAVSLGGAPRAQRELGLARTLLPHLRRALALRRRLDASELAGRTLADGLDRLAVGACVLDRRGLPLLVNRSARAVFDAGDGLRVTAHGLVPSCAADGPGLRAAIRAALDPAGADLARASLLVRRPGGRRPYVVSVSPLAAPADVRETSPRDPAVVLLIADPEGSAQATADDLVRLFGMTPAEARVSVLLLQGRSVAEIQDALDITNNTARSHLKRIFAKTRTRGQADLIRTLLVAMAIGAGTDGGSPR